MGGYGYQQLCDAGGCEWAAGGDGGKVGRGARPWGPPLRMAVRSDGGARPKAVATGAVPRVVGWSAAVGAQKPRTIASTALRARCVELALSD